MSLGGWFRDYVYFPLGGNRVSRSRWAFNLLVVWALTGLWHGAAWNFVVWGLMFAVLLLIEKWLPFLGKMPNILRHAYVLLMILISFVIFNAETMTQAGTDLGNMFGFGGLPAISQSTVYYLKSYGLLFVAGIIGSTPIVKKTGLKVADTKIGMVLEVLILAVLLLVCTGYLVDGSFSPFLYFRF
jgi:alginate O-acetyltransferase complex protein AlgI